MIRQGDKIEILAPFRDDGDDQFVWIAVDDEADGRVTITPTNTGLPLPPTYVVRTNMIRKI